MSRVSAQEPLLVLVATEADGYTFRLHPLQLARVRALQPIQSRFPMIFLQKDVQEDFEAVHGPIAGHVVQLLTGLSAEQLQQFGGVRFVSSGTEQTLLTWSSVC